MGTKNEIVHYIKQKETDGALLLTGKWGCGKTFLINELINENKENLKADIKSDDYVIALVSLYGIDSINSIHDEVKKAVLDAQAISSEKDTTMLSKLKKVAQPIAEALSEKSQTANIVNLALSVTPLDLIEVKKEVICYGTNIKKGIKKRLVLIFDDIERCTIPITDILGTINHYIESKGIKTIIVANEEKVQKADYYEYKEKVVSRTVFLISDYKKIIETIIVSYDETPPNSNYVRTLKDNIQLIFNVYKQSGYNNYRLLKRAIIDFERVYNSIYSLKPNIKNYSTLMSSILYQFFAMYMEIKSGNNPTDDAETILNITYDKYTDFTFTFIPKFIIDWIAFGIFNESLVVHDLSEEFRLIEFQNHKAKADIFFDDPDNLEHLLSAVFLAEKHALSHRCLLILLKRLKNSNDFWKHDNIRNTIDKNVYAQISQAFDKYSYPKRLKCENVGLQELENASNEVAPEAAVVISKMEKIERSTIKE